MAALAAFAAVAHLAPARAQERPREVTDPNINQVISSRLERLGAEASRIRRGWRMASRRSPARRSRWAPRSAAPPMREASEA
jgi:hypothetical protein